MTHPNKHLKQVGPGVSTTISGDLGPGATLEQSALRAIVLFAASCSPGICQTPPPAPPPPTHGFPGFSIHATCDPSNDASDQAGCENAIQLEKKQLHLLDVARQKGEISNREYLARRLATEKRLQKEIQTLRQLDGSGSPSAQPTKPLKFLLAPEATSETSVDNVIWSGAETSLAPITWSGSEDQIFSAHAYLTVPAMTVPNSVNGQCDGVSTVNYEESWWVGIGGDATQALDGRADESLYQVGVRGLLQCYAGTFVPNVIYYGWEEDYPYQPHEVDFPRFTGAVKAGDSVFLSVTSGYDGDNNGLMTYAVRDITQNLATGTGTVTDPDYLAPYVTAEAVTERNQVTGNYFAPMPATSSTGSIFSSAAISVHYYSLGANNAPVLTSATHNLNLSNDTVQNCESVVGWCVSAFLVDMYPNGCDKAQGVGSQSMPSILGYQYINEGAPPKGGCFTILNLQ